MHGSGPAAAQVFCAGSASVARVVDSDLPEGFDGMLSLRGADALDAGGAGAVLARVGALVCWAQAQQARVVARLEELFARDIAAVGGKEDPGLAFSLAAAEVGAILNLPHMTAMRLVDESSRLSSAHPGTLARLAEGRISYRHAGIVLDEMQFVPDTVPGPAGTPDLPGLLEDAVEDPEVLTPRERFEQDLLIRAEGLTAAAFGQRARKLRERQFPGTIPSRHKDALAKRRVCFDALPDGMSCVSAFLAAEKGQALYAALTGAARGEKKAGDERSMDQLRADILASLLLNQPTPSVLMEDTPESYSQIGTEPVGTAQIGTEIGTASGTHSGSRRRAGEGSRRARRTRLTPEVMILINADTLTGMDDNPVELNGYGSLSPQAGRRMVAEAVHWTPLIQDPESGEVLRVGRRRRIPAGLKRWLQARDGTCRFPGCGVNAVRAEIDHTDPWARGGLTDHSNLEHLCPKHHRFKTLGHWKAKQPEAGVLEWVSPTGRTYRTEPMLDYASEPGRSVDTWSSGRIKQESTSDDRDYPCIDEPPPF